MATVKELTSSVNRLSVSTFESMSNLSFQDDEEVKTSNLSLGDEETWGRIVSSTINSWIGKNVTKVTTKGYLHMMHREFDEALIQVIDSFLANEALQQCPRFSFRIIDKSLTKAWDKLRFECLLNDTPVGLHEEVLLNSAETDILTVQVWKKKGSMVAKKDEVLVGTVTIPMSSAVQQPVRKWPIILAKSEVATLTFHMEFHSLKRAPVTIALPQMLTRLFQNNFCQIFNPSSSPCPTVDYFVRVSRTGNSIGRVSWNDSTESETVETIFKIGDISTDVLALTVEAPKSSTVPIKWTTPSKKSKRTSTEILIDHFSLGDPSQNVVATKDAEKLIPIWSVPWSGGLMVEQMQAQWSIEIFAKTDESLGDFDLLSHFKQLYHENLKTQEFPDLFTWDGKLSPAVSMVDATSRPLYGSIQVEAYRALALLEVRLKFPFSHEVAHQAVCELLKPSVTLDTSPRVLGCYASNALESLFGVNQERKYAPNFYRSQVPYLIQSLGLLLNHEQAQEYVAPGSKLRQKLHVRFKLRTNVDMLHFLNEHVARVLAMISRGHRSVSFLGPLVVDTVISECLPVIPSFGRRDLKKTFMIYVVLKKMSVDVGVPLSNLFFDTFKELLGAWSDLAIKEAKQQVECVLQFEKKRHGQSEDRWTDWSDRNEDWLEGAINAQGIFDSCFLMWRDIDWPNPVDSIEFATTLFQGTHSVFKDFINDFLAIITEDTSFDKHEFVLILVSVFISSKYLSKFDRALVDFVTQIEDETLLVVVKDKVSEFSASYSKAVVEADDVAENIVLEFCSSKRKRIAKFVAEHKFESHSDEEESLLPYLDALLGFIHICLLKCAELYQINFEEVKKFKNLLNSNIFKIVDEEIMKNFQAIKKTKPAPEIFSSLVAALPNLIQFRRHLGCQESETLAQISSDLYPRSSPTAELVFKQVQVSSAQLEEKQRMGDISFQIGFIEAKDRIMVKLLSITNVVPREGSSDVSFCLTIAVLPLTKEPFILRKKSLCYDRMRNFVFEDDERAIFTFDLPSKSFDPRELAIQLDLYHQIPYTLQKQFRGTITICLEDVQLIMQERDMKYVPTVSTSFLKLQHVDTVEFKALSRRKDPLAKLYLERYNKQRLEKYFFDRQEWAKADESFYTMHLISEYLENLVETMKTSPRESRGHVKVRLAFHEVHEEVHIEIFQADNISPRPDEEDLNLSLGVWIRPTKTLEKRTLIHPDSAVKTVEFKTRMVFKLRTVNYNYHKTFVQISAYDNTEKSLLSNKAERFCLGHALIRLSDIHPIDSSEKFSNVAPKRLQLQPPDHRNTPLVQAIAKRKDVQAKEFMSTMEKFRDGLPIKVLYDKTDWKEPEQQGVASLIFSHLDQIRLIQYDRVQEPQGTLKYFIGITDLANELHIDLQSITGLVPMANDPCNFSILIVLLPIHNAAFSLKQRTTVYFNRTSLLFDLLDEEADTNHKASKNQHKFVFDLNQAASIDETVIIFELYLHKKTRKYFRGCFIVPLINVNKVSAPRSSLMTSMTSNFSAIPSELTPEFEELQKRSHSDSEAKQFVDRYIRNKEGKSIFTFFPLT